MILYALPLVLLIVLTRDNGGQRSTDLVAQKVAEIYENDHVIIAFVSCWYYPFNQPCQRVSLFVDTCIKQWSWQSISIRVLGSAGSSRRSSLDPRRRREGHSGSQDDSLLERPVLLSGLRLWQRTATFHRCQMPRHHMPGHRRSLFTGLGGPVRRRLVKMVFWFGFCYVLLSWLSYCWFWHSSHVSLAVTLWLSICCIPFRTSAFRHGLGRVTSGIIFRFIYVVFLYEKIGNGHVCFFKRISGEFYNAKQKERICFINHFVK